MSDLISRQAAIETEPGEDVKPAVPAHWIEHRLDCKSGLSTERTNEQHE